jgi:hypothetical protein
MLTVEEVDGKNTAGKDMLAGKDRITSCQIAPP